MGTSLQLDDKIALAVSRGITRRRFFQKSARAAFGLGSALSMSALLFNKPAEATHGCVYGTVSTWGCYCADMTGCGGNCCNGHCCGTAESRCNYWAGSGPPYAWCSLGCCLNNAYGYYRCTDCWQGGQGTGCGNGTNPCVCHTRFVSREC